MLVDLSQLISNRNYLILGVDPQSPPIDCHGLSGIGRLCSRPVGLLFASLLVVQIPHVLQYDSMSCDIDGHQKYLLMYWDVLNCPKWPIMLCAWLMIISISCFPLWIALGDMHITSLDRLFFVKIDPSFIPKFACTFGFSSILEYILSCQWNFIMILFRLNSFSINTSNGFCYCLMYRQWCHHLPFPVLQECC